MKSFFKEYGFVILAAIVVILLIAMTTPIGDLVKNQTTGIVDSFANKTNTKLNAVNIGDNTAKLAYENERLMLNVSSNNSTDTFTAYAIYTSKGKEITDEALSIVNKTAGKYEVLLATNADKNTNIQIKVINDGTQEVFYSNVLLIGAVTSSGGGGTDTKNYISETESYVGKYADVDGDGEVDGIIFADLAFSKSGTWNTYNTSDSALNEKGTYSYSAVSNLKNYTISEDKYNGKFGEAEIISVVKGSTGNDRFYIMALENFTTSSYSTWYWYYSAGSTGFSDYADITSGDFGTGKQNTATMISKWNSSAYGSQNARDIWGAIQTKANDGWFVPSRAEWTVFVAAFNMTSNYDGSGTYTGNGNYNSTYGLSSRCYWSSSLGNSYRTYYVDFHFGCIYSYYANGCDYVRLARTF